MQSETGCCSEPRQREWSISDSGLRLSLSEEIRWTLAATALPVVIRPTGWESQDSSWPVLLDDRGVWLTELTTIVIMKFLHTGVQFSDIKLFTPYHFFQRSFRSHTHKRTSRKVPHVLQSNFQSAYNQLWLLVAQEVNSQQSQIE